jgi:hypothetical protein
MHADGFWADRLHLARDAWITDIRIPAPSHLDAGKSHVGLWARTWFWGGGISEVCLHTHGTFTETTGRQDRIDLITRMSARLREACARARLEFPDSVPCQGLGRDERGRIPLSENTAETLRLHEQVRDVHPTEDLPEDLSVFLDGDAPGLAGALIDAARDGTAVEDRLDPYFGPSRMLRDCQDRKWGYRLYLVPRVFRGERVEFNRQEVASRLLSEDFLCGMTRSSAASLSRMFEIHAPGGARHDPGGNGLPPGFRTVREGALAREAEARSRELPEPE